MMNQRKVRFVLYPLLWTLVLCVGPQLSFGQKLKTRFKTVESENGIKLKVESGKLDLPENRQHDNSRKVTLSYLKVVSTASKPQPPVFLLAGGPGGSWINTFPLEERFEEVMFYRRFSDVIIFDQRGAGESKPNLKCNGEMTLPTGEPLTLAHLKNAYRTMAIECRDHWINRKVDLKSYNTDENANDIYDLRKALGYNKIILVGGSYGSHLGLHYIRKFPETVERSIFYGIEGPDHTWDVPSEVYGAMERIAKVAEQAPYYKNQIPEGGLLYALKFVHNKLKEQTVTVKIEYEDDSVEVEVNELALGALLTYRAGKRNDPTFWPDMILDFYNEDYTLLAQMDMLLREVSAPNAMSNAMDFASGISESRYNRIINDPEKDLLGHINYSYMLKDGIWPENDLGPQFRQNVITDVPVLLIHGDRDLSTPIENAMEVAKHLENGHLIKVIGGTHGCLYELFEEWPPIYEILEDYLLGRSRDMPKEIQLPDLQFPEYVSAAQRKLWDACISGDIEAARSALKDGADVNALDTRKNKNGRRALNWASWYGHTHIIELLLQNGADINAQNNSGYSPLHHAAENCQLQSFVKLMENDADFKAPSKKGQTIAGTLKKSKCRSISSWIRKNNRD